VTFIRNQKRGSLLRMGYDDGECVVCRLNFNGGNTDKQERANVCLGCIHTFSESSHAADNRLIYVLKDRLQCGYGDKIKCEICRKHCTIWMSISACRHHLEAEKDAEKDSEKDSEKESEESSEEGSGGEPSWESPIYCN